MAAFESVEEPRAASSRRASNAASSRDVASAPQEDVGGSVTEREQRVNDLRLGHASRIAPDRILEKPRERRDEIGRKPREIGLARGAGGAADDVIAAVGQRVADQRERPLVIRPARSLGQRLQGRRHGEAGGGSHSITTARFCHCHGTKIQ